MHFKKNKLRGLKVRLLWIVCILLVFAVLFLWFCESALRPILKEYSVNRAQVYVTNIVNEAVYSLLSDHLVNYSNIAVVTRDDAKKVSSIEIDATKINFLK